MSLIANSWDRAWSPQELIDNASNWSLAGDAGLLKYLESFSNNLLSKVQQSNDNINNLLEDLNDVNLSLDIVKNDFHSLHNFQFVESRVYEEDESVSSEDHQENVKEKKPTEEELMSDMKAAVLRGLEVVDKYYDKVEVPASDSEDEADFPSFVLKPKDLYADRPLPYVIGSEEWHKKWHVGLLESSSDSETEKLSEKFSESDTESDLPEKIVSKHIEDITYANTEVGALTRKMLHPAANSTFDESSKQPDIFDSSDSEDYNSAPTQAPILNIKFARELAAKLGDVIEQNPEVLENEVNKRPIQTNAPSRNIGNIFADEPPPLDEDDNLFGSPAPKGLFSGHSGLFDNVDDDLWKEKKSVIVDPKEVDTSKVSNLFKEDDDLFNDGSSLHKSDEKNLKSVSKTIPKITGGLFDDDSEDDLFNENIKSQSLTGNKSFLQTSEKVIMPYFDDEPPELKPKQEDPQREESVKTKKPVGGVKIFSGIDLFSTRTDQLHKTQNAQVDESSKDLPNESGESLCNKKDEDFKEIETQKERKPKTISLFGEGDGVQSNINKIKDADLAEITGKPIDKPNTISLFDDDDELFGDDLFLNLSSKKFVTSLFNDEPSFIEKDVAASKPVKVDKNDSNVPDDLSVKGNKSKSDGIVKEVKKPKNISLFSDSDEDIDDLFSSNITSLADEIVKDEDKSLVKQSQSFTGVNLFEQNPPDDDSEWETKSEANLFEDNYSSLFENIPELSSQRSGLFDNEPPSLFSESSGIVKDISARVETDDSFNPLTSSSRRFSSDIFNEQQSGDSFFVTKNKSYHDAHATYNYLGSITEIPDSSYSNLEITPSGNVDDIFGDYTISVTKDTEEVQDTPSIIEHLKEEKSHVLLSEQRVIEDIDTEEAKLGKTEPVSNSLDKDELKLNESVLAKIGSPGKLKHNMNINVDALIPGTLPPKKVSFQKSKSLDASLDDDSGSARVSRNLSSSSITDDERNKNNDSFKNNVPNPEILRCVTKDRVRIPIKRKPSTRRARQELIRNSGADFKVNLSSDAELSNPAMPIESTKNENEDVSDDLFLSKTVFKEGTLGRKIKNEEEDFSSNQIQKESNLKTDLFNDENSDDDIFSAVELPPKSNILKKSLFDDELDDDDIFGSSSIRETFGGNGNKTRKTVPVRKLLDTKVEDDPLGLFNDCNND